MGDGFTSWNKKDRLDIHIGKSVNSDHNIASRKCADLIKQSQSIGVALFKQSDQAKKDYRIRLEASIDCGTWLLQNGLALRGHNESENSTSKGNFLELLEFHFRGRDHIENVVLKNAPKNLLMTSPDVQRDIVNAIAFETTKAIINDIGDDLFTILQMAIVLRYVNQEGSIVERFLGISHVKDTKALTLKKEIEYMLVTHGEINGLKTLILAENSAAYYVHCFAHQLQLTLVAVAKSHGDVSGFFTMSSSLINLVGSSCKRRDNI
ncbi:Zinc finger MYM-type protein 1 [Linum perenne]